MRTLLRFAMSFAVVAYPLCVSAGVIGFHPPQAEYVVGSTVVLDILATDLNLGAFDLTVEFDPLLLSPTTIEFDTFLGSPLSIQDSSIGFSSLSLAETSLLSPGELILLQQGGFRLARLDFDALMPGVTAVSFTSAIVSDPDGVLFSPDLGSAIVTIQARDQEVVPEPGSGPLLVLGLLLIARRLIPHRRR